MFLIFLWSSYFAHQSLLHHFISSGDHEQVALICDNGADTAAPKCQCIPPLHLALKLKKNECVKVLLDRGADPNLKSHTGSTPLITAINADNNYGIQLLLQYKANCNQTNNKGELPIFHAVNKHNPEAVTFLLEHGSEITHGSDSALMYSIKVNDPESARILLKHGAPLAPSVVEYAAKLDDPSAEMLLETPDAFETAHGHSFIETIERQLTDEITAIETRVDTVKRIKNDPTEFLQLVVKTKHRLSRFDTLLSMKKVDTETERDALIKTPVSEYTRPADEAIGKIVSMWAEKLQATHKLHAEARQEIITPGGIRTFDKWQAAVESRRDFIENLLERGIDESLEFRTIEERKQHCSEELKYFDAMIERNTTKIRDFQKLCDRFVKKVRESECSFPGIEDLISKLQEVKKQKRGKKK